MADSIALWNRAIAEAWERKVVLGRYGTQGGAGAIAKGQSPFSHPLYRGWSADREIVNAVEGLHKPPGQITRNALDATATFKNSVFGLIDFAVSGVQGLKAIGTGGVQLFANQIVRSLSLLRLAPAKHFREILESGKLPLLTKMVNGGLHLGLGPSAVTPGKGTFIKYIPVVGKTLDRPVSAIIDKKAQVEFGIILNWLRVQLAEGNLLMLHMAGRDINDPKVWKTAMDWANTMSGASRGAQTPGRRALETASRTSFQMTRSEIATLGGIAKAAVSGTGSERILATMTLASFGAMVYGLGSAINMAFGKGPVEFDPRKGDWATIQVGDQNIPIIPNRGLVRAMSKSIVALGNEDPEKVTQIWAQYALSKQGPGVTGPAANALGFGFDPDEGFRTGDLPATFRFINAAPLPPLVSSLILEEDQRNAVSAGFQFAGFNPFPESPFEKRNQARQEEMQRRGIEGSFEQLRADNPPLASEIDASPLVTLAAEKIGDRRDPSIQSRAFTSVQELRDEGTAEQEVSDSNLKEFFGAVGKLGMEDASEQHLSPKRWADNTSARAQETFFRKDSILEFAGVDFEGGVEPAPGSPGAVIDAYFSVDIREFTDSQSEIIDFAGFFGARDKALGGLSGPQRRDALRFINKFETPVERAFREARDIPELSAYFEEDVGRDRERFRRRNPEVDAILWMTGSGTTGVKTRKAQTAAVELVNQIFKLNLTRRDVPRVD